MSQTSVDLFAHAGVAAVLGTSNTVAVPLRYTEQKPRPQELTPGLFEPYRVQRLNIPGARRHPHPLVESTCLASVRPPMPKYRPLLEPMLISSGDLSHEQLEQIVYAGEAHQHYFTYLNRRHVDIPTMRLGRDGTEFATTKREEIVEEITARHGFYVPGGTGTGKGRIICGILTDNLNQGRTRAVYLTANDILINDVVRDWTDLGRSADDVVRWKNSPLGRPIKVGGRENFILAGTYSMLQHRSKKQTRTRVDDLVEFLGDDFDGVLAFDEAHFAANAAPLATAATPASQQSQQGAAMLELQNRLPHARVVYISATGFSRIDAFAYAIRLGLFGTASTFANHREFVKAMDAGGTAALETIARDLKARGLMFAPQLSFEGVTYERIEHTLDEVQVESYNTYVRAWRLVHTGIDQELIALNAVDTDPDDETIPVHVDGGPFKKLHSMTSHAEQLFLSQAIHSLQMPTAIQVIREKLAKGNAVLCQLTHTGEAALNDALAQQGEDETGDLTEIDTTHRTALIDFVRKNYPIHEYQRVYHHEKKRFIAVPKLDKNQDPIVNKAALVRRGEMIDAVREVVFPLPILDQLHKHFPGQVAEVSGRRKWIETIVDDDGVLTQRVGKRSANANETAIADFEAGRKLILAFTEGAGGAGLSFHASRKIINQRKRSHLFLEMSWSAEKAIQGMGRSHRTAQVVEPEYCFLSISNLPGQKRLTSTPARKIAALGALTRGHREAASNGAFRPEDNLETSYSERAMKVLIADVIAGKVPDVDQRTFEREMRMRLKGLEIVPPSESWLQTLKRGAGANRVTMARFLNRLMSCSIGLDGGLQQLIMDAFYGRLEDVISEAIENNLYDTGIETLSAAAIATISRERLGVDDFGAATDLIELLITDVPNGSLRFGQARQERIDYERLTGNSDAFYAVRDGNVELHIPTDTGYYTTLLTPKGVRDIRPVSDLTVISETEAEGRWNTEFAELPRLSRTRYLAVGCLTPVWAKMPSASEVYRLRTDDGELLLGRVIHPSYLDDLRNAFGVATGADVPEPTPLVRPVSTAIAA
jgi:hypothetical protein